MQKTIKREWIQAVSYTHLDVYKRQPLSWNKLCLAPLWLKNKFVALIDREIQRVNQGMEGRIIAKMNSLCDPVIMESLYRASAAGVKDVYKRQRIISCSVSPKRQPTTS